MYLVIQWFNLYLFVSYCKCSLLFMTPLPRVTCGKSLYACLAPTSPRFSTSAWCHPEPTIHPRFTWIQVGMWLYISRTDKPAIKRIQYVFLKSMWEIIRISTSSDSCCAHHNTDQTHSNYTPSISCFAGATPVSDWSKLLPGRAYIFFSGWTPIFSGLKHTHN